MTSDLTAIKGIVLLPPGDLSAWGDAFLQRLADQDGTIKIVRAHFLEALPDIAAEDQCRTILICDYPPLDLLKMVSHGAIPTVCLADPPHSAVQRIMMTLGVPLVDALRRYTAAATAFPLLSGENTLIIRRSNNTTGPEVADALVRHLSIDGTLGSALSAEVQPYTPLACAALEDEERQIVSDVTMGLFNALGRRLDQAIIWPRAVLSWGGHPGEAAPEYIDLAGPNRVLYHGPYFYLPAGTYSLKAHIGFSPEALDHPFALEVHGVSCLGRVDFRPTFGGWCFVDLEFPHHVPTDRIEVHLTSMRGAIDGRIALNSVTITAA